MAERRILAAGTPALAWLFANLLTFVSGAVPHASLAADVHAVALENMQFVPSTLEVKPGDRVEWVNKDLVPHTVTSTSGVFDSHSIAPGASWTYTADTPGSYPYTCQFHPGMLGTVVVR